MPDSDPIAVFYDAHPYPPPVDDIVRWLQGWDEESRRVEHFRHWPTLPYAEDMSILIAGCGTSQAARWAARHPAAKVVGIDVSPASLESTDRLKHEHRLDNLELSATAVEDVASLGARFDLTVCTGVLHHLADPDAGLRALRDVTEPDGALNLMVYAAYGRFGVSMLQDYARHMGLSATPGEIEELTEVLKELPMGHPMSHALRNSSDFADPDAIADALLNPRERAYTVPDVFEALEGNGLRFGRWVHQAPYRPQCGIMSRLSHGQRIARKPENEQFALMELFRGTITRHSFIAYRDDAPFRSPLLDRDDPTWTRWVPLVPSSVMVVTERVPPGYAAAVINRAHIDTDLVLFLTTEELEVLSVIDGRTRGGDIPGSSRELLHRLWLQDLVVIDASHDH